MTSTYLLRQADALINLSRATFDLTVAGRLRVLAAEFRSRRRNSSGTAASPANSRRPITPHSIDASRLSSPGLTPQVG
jgi:hypothetical protein